MKMKPAKLTLASLTILALLAGAVVISTMPVQAITADQVKIEPKPFDLENPDGVYVHVKLSVDDVSVVDQIDPDTVLLEGYMTPISTWTTRPPKNPWEFIAQFDGTTVAAHVITKASHMSLATPHPWVPIKIPLTITGLLYDGTSWEGTGKIKVYLPDPPAPAVPPPP